MKLILSIFLLAGTVSAFVPVPTTTTAPVAVAVGSRRENVGSLMELGVGYVPDGLTPEQYEKILQKDRAKTAGKDLGRVGPQGFRSRSMQGWQEAFERGETTHTFAPLNYRKLLKEKQLRKKDIPYMVRGGSWDDSDLFRNAGDAKKKKVWRKVDKEYAKGGYKKEQSVSILGSGPGLNWTGERRDNNDTKRSYPGFF